MDLTWLYVVLIIVMTTSGSLAQQDTELTCPAGSTGTFVCDRNPCYTRSRLGETNFVCECTQPFFMGYTCTVPSGNQFLETCYGTNCRSGYFESPNYPNLYDDRDTRLYLLYIPGLPEDAQIQFSFDSPFHIETGKDALYVGRGLQFNFNQINDRNDPPEKYFFEGNQRPGPFSMQTDAVWLYFLTDKNIEQVGFRLRWNVIDDTPPSVQCPGDITDVITDVSPGQPGKAVSWQEPVATDDSNVQPILVSRSHVPDISIFNAGIPTIVVYTYADMAGNRASCTFTVSIVQVDNVPPNVRCPADIIKPVPCCPNPFSGTVVTWTEPVATDNSGLVTRISRSHVSGNIFQLGTTMVMYQYRDSSNNVAGCSFTITVEFVDSMSPVVQCPPDLALVIPFGETGSVATWLEPRVNDESGSVILETQSHNAGDFFLVGRTQVTYRYIDGAGNRASCDFIVFVTNVDTSGPVVTCPEDVTEMVTLNSPGANVEWNEPTAVDDSGRAIPVFQSHMSGAFFGRGTTTVTYMYVDDRGNGGGCSFDVHVDTVDRSPPTLTCPRDITQSVTLNSGGATITWQPPSVRDNSGSIQSQTSTHNSGDFFGIGATTVEYMASDASGNIGRCSFQVAIVTGDEERPMLVCPNDVVINIDSGQSRRMMVNWQPPVPSDNSGQVSIIFNTHNPGDYFFVGTTEVSYVAQDSFGNIGQCSFNVIVNTVDSIGPTVTCPEDISRTIPVGIGGSTVSWREPVTSDNSGGAVRLVSRTSAPGSFFTTGTAAVTYVYADSFENQGTCTFRIFISEVDTIPPDVYCPEDVTIRLGSQSPGTPVFWPEATATDNSGMATLVSRDWQPGDFFTNPSENTVTYEFTDQAGNRGRCSFAISIQLVDSQPPITMNCPMDLNSVVPVGTAGAPVSWQEPTATDESGNAMIASASHNPGSFFPVGMTRVNYRFTDTVGNVATCSFNVVVTEVDTIPPTVSCPRDIRRTTTLGSSALAIFWSEPTTSDNSGNVLLVDQSHYPGNPFQMGETTVTYRYSDMAGNVAECSFIITVSAVDTEPPVVTCPGDITTTTALGSQGTTVTWPEPTATDDSGQVTQLSRSLPSGSFFAVGVPTTVVYVYQDSSQNTGICSFSVIVNPVDLAQPMCSQRQDVDQTVDIGSFGTMVYFVEPQASDNSGIATLRSRTHSPGAFFRVGQTEVCYRFGDPENNMVDCCFTVSVTEVDNTPPQILFCPSDFTLASEVGTLGATATWPTPQAIDNAGPVTTQSASHNSGDFFQLGNTQVNYIFADQTGKTVQCTFTVIVRQVDTIPPAAQCPAYITRTAGLGVSSVRVFWDEPVVTDNSGDVTRESSHFSGQSFPIGDTVVMYTFTDVANNIATCTFTITITQVDNTNPVVTCPADVVKVVSLNAQNSRASWDPPSASDNSGEVFLVSNTHSPNDLFTVGITMVTYTYRDPSNNMGSCVFDVIIIEVDSVPPTVSCPQDVTQTVPFGSFNPVTVTWMEPVTSDNSGNVVLVSRSRNPGDTFTLGPSTTVTYNYQDNSGNRAMCSFTVTVMQASDTQPPFISNCPNDKELTIPLGQSTTDVSWQSLPMATDNSGTAFIQFTTRNPSVNIYQSSSSSVLALNVPVGVTLFTATAMDNSGNVAECSFSANVIQVDNTPPVAECPADITETAGLGVSNIPVFWTPPMALDNGGAVNRGSSHFPGQSFPVGETTVMYTFRDLANNVASCSFTVTVMQVDNMNPVVTCPADVVKVVSLNAQNSRASWNPPSATDNSGEVFLVSNTHSPNDFFPVGITMVTYTYRDPSNNIESCVFDVIVIEIDSEPPSVTCPQDVTQTVPFGSFNPVSVTWMEPVTSDNSGNVVLVSRSRNPGDTFTLGPSTTVTYNYQDNNGNRAMCSFTVTVMQASDTQPPVFTSCTNDQEVSIPLERSTADVTWNYLPTATDNSGIPNIQYRTRSPGVSIFQSGGQILALNVPVGLTLFTAIATDSGGNTAECQFSANVIQGDRVPPTLICPPDQTGSMESGSSTTTSVVFPEATANDNSGRAPSVTYSSNSPTAVFLQNPDGRTQLADNIGRGQTLVFVTATDDSGNTVTCTFTITVSAVDTTPPTITSCPQNQALQISTGGTTRSFTVSQAQATDNSGINPTIGYTTPNPGVSIFDNAVGSVFVNNVPVGVTIITVTATDGFNNMAMCTFTITISSNPPPTIICPPNQSANPDPGSSLAFLTFSKAVASDDSDDSGITPNVNMSAIQQECNSLTALATLYLLKMLLLERRQ
ncbi:hyalin-like [Amphiura filiformis]|uniref:hyalin-like n=1 Tax=Amphiura filiformis TaxID=82378 RepID=UPI003B21EA84